MTKIILDKAPPLFEYIRDQIKKISNVYDLEKVLKELRVIVKVYLTNDFYVVVDEHRNIITGRGK